MRTSLVIIRSVGIGRYSGGAPLEDCIVVTVESEEVLGGVESESDEPSEYLPRVPGVHNTQPICQGNVVAGCAFVYLRRPTLKELVEAT